jgi:hypothetical protein
MISAYRAGLAAGSTASHQPVLTVDEQKLAVQDEIAKREQLGVAHLIPKEDFIKGFLDGYRTSLPLPDGLTRYVSKH